MKFYAKLCIHNLHQTSGLGPTMPVTLLIPLIQKKEKRPRVPNQADLDSSPLCP